MYCSLYFYETFFDIGFQHSTCFRNVNWIWKMFAFVSLVEQSDKQVMFSIGT